VSHWLDSNVFIQSHKGPYGFDMAPGFWTGILRHAATGAIKSPMEVYHELSEQIDKKDALAIWARDHKDEIFVEPDQEIQRNYQVVGDYVAQNYEASFAAKFMNDADPWLIAHAMSDQDGLVVTLEVAQKGRQVKIPNVCDHFKVPYINTFDLIRRLKISLA
jgi:hypothetical protein